MGVSRGTSHSFVCIECALADVLAHTVSDDYLAVLGRRASVALAASDCACCRRTASSAFQTHTKIAGFYHQIEHTRITLLVDHTAYQVRSNPSRVRKEGRLVEIAEMALGH